MSSPVKLKADIFWAYFDKVNDLSQKYQVDLCNLSDDAVAALEAMGITVNSNPKKPEQGRYITCKSVNPIRPQDSSGNHITAIVANNSKATAMVSTYEWKFMNKKGISPSLMKIVITDLKEYNPEGVATADMDDDIL